MKNIIFIVGATASGKSELALKLASDLNCEIINADAFQVYKELNIGVNKPNLNDLKKIKHHFINNISINEEWNIKKFQDAFFDIILNSNKNYIVVGGSNLYIDCVIKNYSLTELKEINLEKITNEEKWSILKKLDEKESEKIDPNNIKRIEQAIRIIYSKEIRKTNLINNETLINPFIIKIEEDRNILYNKINKRVDQMINNGWENEINDLLKNYNVDCQAFQAIGYKEILNSIKFHVPIDIEIIKRNTRRYAKRQETWIKNKFKINFLFNKKNNNYFELIQIAKKFINI